MAGHDPAIHVMTGAAGAGDRVAASPIWIASFDPPAAVLAAWLIRRYPATALTDAWLKLGTFADGVAGIAAACERVGVDVTAY